MTGGLDVVLGHRDSAGAALVDVDVDQDQPQDIARDFLIEKGLIEE